MKALIVGLGSVGIRHLNNLVDLGIEEFVVCRERGLAPPDEIRTTNIKTVSDLNQAMAEKPDFAVVASPTFRHFETALSLIQQKIPVYLEKPGSTTPGEMQGLLLESEKLKVPVTIGYQLRFHPTLKMVKSWLKQNKIGRVFSVRADVGEYLPDFHPWEDYRGSYAAKSAMGGGVLLTLSHEIDYLHWLFGDLEDGLALGGKWTPLEIDVEDHVLALLQFSSGAKVSLSMDYWRKPPVRQLKIVGEDGEIHWDYFSNVKMMDRNGSVKDRADLPSNFDRNQMFLQSMRDFLSQLNGNPNLGAVLQDGLKVLQTIDKIKKQITR